MTLTYVLFLSIYSFENQSAPISVKSFSSDHSELSQKRPCVKPGEVSIFQNSSKVYPLIKDTDTVAKNAGVGSSGNEG